jgi:hypothetical protein
MIDYPALRDAVFQKIANLPFVCHVRLHSHASGDPAWLDIAIEAFPNVHVHRSIQLHPDRVSHAIDALARHVRASVTDKLATSWQANKPANGYLGIMEGPNGQAWYQAMPWHQGTSPQQRWRRPLYLMPSSPVMTVGEIDAFYASLSYRETVEEYQLQEYNPVTRVAWYRRIA